MKRIAMILDTLVDNVALWDGKAEWSPTDGHLLVDVTDNLTVGPGDLYDPQTQTFSRPPEPPVPLNQQLEAIFKSLPDEVRAEFYTLKTSVQQALTDGDILAAKAMIVNAPVPSSLEPVRAAMVAKFNEVTQ